MHKWFLQKAVLYMTWEEKKKSSYSAAKVIYLRYEKAFKSRVEQFGSHLGQAFNPALEMEDEWPLFFCIYFNVKATWPFWEKNNVDSPVSSCCLMLIQLLSQQQTLLPDGSQRCKILTKSEYCKRSRRQRRSATRSECDPQSTSASSETSASPDFSFGLITLCVLFQVNNTVISKLVSASS